MKFNKLGLISALCVSSLLGNTTALAGDTANVAVSASVTGTCKFNSGGSIAFTLDPTSAAAATGVVTNPAFWCTKGTSYTVTDNSGLYAASGARRLRHSTILTEFIPYTFSYTATGSGTGKTTPITLTLGSASVANVDFVNAAAGPYADTVILTIAP